eukprot:TRINITY_DN21698_c0_g1_i1.p1 TRINITY_DN21698_c0_g1~~TRINITY_DN21698_c0_g1_i1.p1  ORF type:complete len:346 (+),score=94.32 TRINITY_DN21698_c0_g1_i1:327-1364(+)
MNVREDKIMDGRQALIVPVSAKHAVEGKVEVVIKRVTSEHILAKPEGAVRESFVKSAEREIDFYQHQLKPTIAALWPKCYLSYKSKATTPEFLMVIEDMYEAGFNQEPGLTDSRMRDGLEALAVFHAAYWRDETALKEEQGAFWPLYKRHDSEKDKVAVAAHWERVCKEFPQLDSSVGTRVLAASESLDATVRGTCVTRIHGDAKGPNMFFRDTEGPLASRVRLIDAQWTGRGNPYTDVANLITAGLQVQLLPEFDEYLAHYEENLLHHLPAVHHAEYKDLIKPTWDACWLDYARVVMLGLWAKLSKERLVANRNNVGSSMVGRSEPHVEFIVARAAATLKDMGH